MGAGRTHGYPGQHHDDVGRTAVAGLPARAHPAAPLDCRWLRACRRGGPDEPVGDRLDVPHCLGRPRLPARCGAVVVGGDHRHPRRQAASVDVRAVALVFCRRRDDARAVAAYGTRPTARFGSRPGSWAALAYIGLLAGPFGTWCVVQATAPLPTVVSSVGFLTTPAVSLVLANLFLGEAFTVDLLLGSALIIGGVGFAAWPGRPT